jgi:hypothetical protein
MTLQSFPLEVFADLVAAPHLQVSFKFFRFLTGLPTPFGQVLFAPFINTVKVFVTKVMAITTAMP